MASKGQKFNKYAPELKQDILNKYLSNIGTFGSLSKEYGIPKQTIKGWIAKTRKGNNIIKENRGRPKKNKDIDYKERYEILKNYQAFLKAQREKK